MRLINSGEMTKWERWFVDKHPGMVGPFLRGTPEWNEREEKRRALGCQCLSFGPIPKGFGRGEEPTDKQKSTIAKMLRGSR